MKKSPSVMGKAPKKISSGKSSVGKKPLVIASGQAAFWVHNGPVLKSLADLKNFLATATLDQFFYHTKRGGNDFAKWVRAVLHENKCADDLEKSDTPKKSLAAITKSLKTYRL